MKYGANISVDQKVANRAYQNIIAGRPIGRHRLEDVVCKVCRRDNRNGTHAALERVGHLSHSFKPGGLPNYV